MSCGWMPSPTESAPCGSKSTRRTRRPTSARAAPRLIVVVVLPTPPFWLQTATVRAGPCSISGSGLGKAENGLPVGPSSPTWGSVIRDAATSTNLLGYGRDVAHGTWLRTLGPRPGAGKQARRLGLTSLALFGLRPRRLRPRRRRSRLSRGLPRPYAGYRAGWAPRSLATAGPNCRQVPMPRLGSAAVVRRPVGLAAAGDRVVEHLVLLAHAGVAEVSRGTAVRGPGGRTELVQAVVAGRVHDLSLTAGLAGDHALSERPAAAYFGGALGGRSCRGGLRRGDLGRRGRRWPEKRGRAGNPRGLDRDAQHLSGLDDIRPVDLAA